MPPPTTLNGLEGREVGGVIALPLILATATILAVYTDKEGRLTIELASTRQPVR